MILENDDYIIFIDKKYEYKSIHDSLYEKGGYVILYDGELRKKKKSITLDDSNNIFNCLDTFLSFINGRRISTMFIHGVYKKEVKWIKYSGYSVDSFKYVKTWPQRFSVKGINEAWNKFYLLWKDEDNRDFLKLVIHWYVQANGNVGLVEGSIIMAQTALELIYNWWIVEKKVMIKGQDSENIFASNKIRLLLSQLGIDHEIPNSFIELKKYVKNNPDISDAPEAIAQIRNAIVHSQLEKRKKLFNINIRTKYETLQTCIWYIELSLLRILDFQDLYYNRCLFEKHASKLEEYVPWNKTKE